jgi:hypothetical protein
MADKKISELDAITGAATAADDFFIVVDTSGSATKKISRAELNNAIEQDVLAQVDITSANIDGGTIDNTPIGSTTPSTGDFTTVDTTGDVTVGGNLTVNGTTTTVNSTTLDVDDINITVASGAADAAAADGAGLTVDGASATFNYASTGDKWTMNKPLDVTGTVTATSFSGDGSSLTGISTDLVGDTSPQLGGNLDLNGNNITGTGDISTTGTATFTKNASGEQRVVLSNNDTATAAAAAFVASNGTNEVRLIRAGTSYSSYGSFTSNDGAVYSDHSVVVMADNASGVIKFASGGNSEKVRISSAGNLQAGATSGRGGAATGHLFKMPSGDIYFEIMGSTTSANTDILFSDGTGGSYGVVGYDHTNDALRFFSNSGERMRIDSIGNVGIGTTPVRTLDIATTTGGTIIHLTDDSTGHLATDGVDIQQEGTLFQILNREAGDIRLGTNGTERVRIDSSGNLLVGCTSLPSSSVAGAGFDASNASELKCSVGGTGNSTQIRFLNPNGEVGAIRTSGTATSYVTSSDYRLKENVTADWDATTRLKQLNPVRFNFISDADTTVDGFLAHEVQSVVPEAITGTHNEVDDDGNPVYQGIDQSKLVPLLVKTIQELEARIATLEAK